MSDTKEWYESPDHTDQVQKVDAFVEAMTKEAEAAKLSYSEVGCAMGVFMAHLCATVEHLALIDVLMSFHATFGKVYVKNMKLLKEWENEKKSDD